MLLGPVLRNVPSLRRAPDGICRTSHWWYAAASVATLAYSHCARTGDLHVVESDVGQHIRFVGNSREVTVPSQLRCYSTQKEGIVGRMRVMEDKVLYQHVGDAVREACLASRCGAVRKHAPSFSGKEGVSVVQGIAVP